MVLACFIYKIALNNGINCKYYCNNYIYNRAEAGQVPVFKAYNVIAKLGMIYLGIAEYSNVLLSSEC